MNRSLGSATLVCIALFVTGCSVRVREEAISNPARDANPTQSSSCIAISGGGIRSGAVSLGILQEYHSNRLLAGQKLLSTVSGGGYPVYGLVYRMLRDRYSLDELLRDDGEHIAAVEKNADFISEADYRAFVALTPLHISLASFTHYGGPQPTYSAKIHKTFVGRGQTPFRFQPRLSDARKLANTSGLPEFVFGASASLGGTAPSDGYCYKPEEFFELSPQLSGSPEYGYFATLSEHLFLDEAIAISAAAIDAPIGDVTLPEFLRKRKVALGTSVTLGTTQKKEIYLADGGFIDNLGILPLLRHGCRNIVAFDNSADSAAEFKSWDVFKAHAAKMGWGVTGNEPIGAPAQTGGATDGWSIALHVHDLEITRGNDRVRIRLVKLGLDRTSLDRYPSEVSAYARENWNEHPPACNGEKGLDERCSFPLESTVRQSFEEREFRAYRILGRCLAHMAITDDTSCEQL